MFGSVGRNLGRGSRKFAHISTAISETPCSVTNPLKYCNLMTKAASHRNSNILKNGFTRHSSVFSREFSSESKPSMEEPETAAEETEKEHELRLDELRKDATPHEKDASIAATDTSDIDFTLKLTEEEMQELSKGDPEIIKKIQYIQLEHEVYRQEGMRVPTKLQMRRWKELLLLPTVGARRKFYAYLWMNEMRTMNTKLKKQAMKEQRLQDLEGSSLGPLPEHDPLGITYGLNRNTLFLRLYETTVNRFYHNKIINAMMFSRPLVLDLSYDEFMSPRESKNCAKQIEMLIGQNRTHPQPFDLHLCNARQDYKIVHYLRQMIPTLYEDIFPINITENSYLDIFPRKNIVYLTPHAREELEEFNEDEIYIVGGMVDKSDPRPFSLAKAKKENLRMKKLPLDKHLVWGMGNKSLTINQVTAIMLDLRFTGDWKTALNHVPMRKLNRDYHPYPNQNRDEEEHDEPGLGTGGQRRDRDVPERRWNSGGYSRDPEAFNSSVASRQESSRGQGGDQDPAERRFGGGFSRDQDKFHTSRREKKSQVVEDFRLLSRRKGYRRFDSSSANFSELPSTRENREGSKSYGNDNDQRNFKNRNLTNIRKIFDD